MNPLIYHVVRSGAAASPTPTPTPTPGFSPSTYFSGARAGCAIDLAYSATWQDEAQTTAASANTNPVALVTDMSGNSHPVSIAGGASSLRPVLAGVGGAFRFLTYDDTDDRLRTSGWSMPAAWDRIGLFRLNTGVDINDTIFNKAGGGNGAYLYVNAVGATANLAMYGTNNGPILASLPLDTWMVITERWNGSNSKMRLNTNAYTATSSPGTISTDGLGIGSDGAAAYANIGFAAVYQGVFSDAECDAIVAELMTRAGL